ncbi:hypothetical protein [Mumia zhuanghuii]|uniref:hypothetical protein n=1 Tax=Mumia zhuanghuii TaxID=2585211 RepID=UPI003633C192
MYVPRFNALDDDAAIDTLIRTVAAGDLVTADADGIPYATRCRWSGCATRTA